MKEIIVRSEHEYRVSFTDTWRNQLSAICESRNSVIITQAGLRDRVAAGMPDAKIIVTPDGEEQKTISTFSRLLQEVADFNLDRQSLIIGIGGGATTDLAGFVAATYMRGIDWVAIPTSVAGMVDASVGGKTGINLSAGKNLVGAFHSPIEVIVDMNWLDTLAPRDVKAGLAESVKCGFISDKRILELFLEGYKKNLAEIVHRSIQVKARVVSKDFRESFEREDLNYGHTLGHAIERHSGYSLRHGEAISIGMIFAAEVSHIASKLPLESVKLHYEILRSLDLPISYEVDAWSNLFSVMTMDKKRRSSAIRFVTLEGIGRTGRAELDFSELERIYKAKVAR